MLEAPAHITPAAGLGIDTTTVVPQRPGTGAVQRFDRPVTVRSPAEAAARRGRSALRGRCDPGDGSTRAETGGAGSDDPVGASARWSSARGSAHIGEERERSLF